MLGAEKARKPVGKDLPEANHPFAVANRILAAASGSGAQVEAGHEVGQAPPAVVRAPDTSSDMGSVLGPAEAARGVPEGFEPAVMIRAFPVVPPEAPPPALPPVQLTLPPELAPVGDQAQADARTLAAARELGLVDDDDGEA